MTLLRYVWNDLLRNPRRTLASMAGVVVGVGLFSAVLFFIDGSGASMTTRALAPLALDSQRVLTAPLGGGVLLERNVADHTLSPGDTTTVTLIARNDGIAPAHEVVVRDGPTDGLAYVPGSTTVDAAPVADATGDIPLHQGAAGIGLNIGTVSPGASRHIAYRVTARRATRLGNTGHATLSTREAVTPAPANAPRATRLARLAAQVARVPGVRAADPLVSVGMEPGTMVAHGKGVPGPVRLFSFDRHYRSHYPSIRLLSGSQQSGGVLISAEAARSLRVAVGDRISLVLPGGAPPLELPVNGITDMSQARPLFYSREPASLEKFNYVRFTVVVDHDTYQRDVVPAFERAAASRSSSVTSLPLEELDILVDRHRLHSDPGAALAQTRRVAEDVLRVAPGQDYLIDNISNTLEVARGDAAVAKRMFVFLGLPGAILAALLTAYAGTLLAQAQRRENALLRVRGANRGHLLFLLAARTISVAGIGSVLGVALGFVTVAELLGRAVLLQASTTGLVQSALIGVGGGMAVTAVALYLPGRRLITQDINQDLTVTRRTTPGWMRLNLYLLALVAACVAQLLAIRLGALDIPPGSVYAGRSVSLPIQLLIAPIAAWLAGTLLVAHLLHQLAARVPTDGRARFGPLLRGLLWRSVVRRLGALRGGVVAVGLVVGLGTMLTCFSTSYDRAKTADARFLVGADIRITPNPTGTASHLTSLVSRLHVRGTGRATAVVYAPENAVLTSATNEDVASLAAIDPHSYPAVAAVHDGSFANGSTVRTMAAMDQHPDGVLVNAALAEGLKVKAGDKVKVMFGRGTSHQRRLPARVLGLFTQFPGAPKGTDIVANLGYYQRSTGLKSADYFLVSVPDARHGGLADATHALGSLPGFASGFVTQTSSTALDKDQSSLTALNVLGLLRLSTFYTFLMAATASGMFVFGLLLQRRREYVTLRAQGMRSGEIRRLVLAEAGLCASLGTIIGIGVGVGMASQFTRVLRPIFTLPPTLALPAVQIALLAALVFAATLLSSTAAAVLLGRIKPTELLREE